MTAATSTTAKVTGEYYRVTYKPLSLVRYASAAHAIAAVYVYMAKQTGKPGWLRFTSIERVTTHEPVPNSLPEWIADRTETVTGSICVESPGQLSERPEMSRYSPVNGWCVPEVIEVRA